MAPTKAGYTASHFALEIDGQFAGWPSSVEGGVAYGVVLEKTSGSGPTDKSISEVKYNDLVLTCGVPESTLADWLAKFLKGQEITHGGAVSFLDHNYQSLRRLEWDNGTIVELTLPALSGAATESAWLTITIRPEVTRSTTGPGVTLPSAGGKAPGSKSWEASNFSISIPGVSCTHVATVEALTITQTFIESASGRRAPKPGPLFRSETWC